MYIAHYHVANGSQIPHARGRRKLGAGRCLGPSL